MSNALAFATVTQALALLIENNLRPEIDMAVSVETRKPHAEPPTDPSITVFLYQVTPNASMRHTDLPTRACDGTLLKRPAAAMDLNFLISAYGEEAELVGQRLIGCVVRTLHEMPVLPKELIEEAAERPYLEGSNLAESVQKVRFTPIQMDVDETSKLWGMLYQTPYTLSVAYQASLVLIDGREEPVPAKPVERRTVRTLPFGAPGAPVPPGAGGDDAGGSTDSGRAGGRTADNRHAGGHTADSQEEDGAAGNAGSVPGGEDAAADTAAPTGRPAAKKSAAARSESAASPSRSKKAPTRPVRRAASAPSGGTDKPGAVEPVEKRASSPGRTRKSTQRGGGQGSESSGSSGTSDGSGEES